MAEAFGDELASSTLNHFNGFVFAWLEDEAWRQGRSDGVWLLTELGSGQTCARATHSITTRCCEIDGCMVDPRQGYGYSSAFRHYAEWSADE